MSDPVLTAEGVSRVFGTGPAQVIACQGIDLSISAGEVLVLRGRSGSGKTTLMNILGSLDRPTTGTVRLGDLDLGAAPESTLVEVRRNRFGFIFQSTGLLPMLSAAENVEVPLRLLRTPADERAERVAELLDLVGLEGHGEQRPGELSGGQQQRVGIARALASRPEVLFADEPTGQLDSATGAAMMDLLFDLAHRQGVAAFITTHDAELMRRADRVLQIHDGHLVGDGGHGRHSAAS